MGGGLLQLVAYGAQDVYLTGNPQITFFKVVYRRHTNFSMEAIAQTFNGVAKYGNRVTAQISRNGDLIGRMYVVVDVPAGGSAVYTKYYGQRLLKRVDIEIGGQLIDRQYSHWLYIWNELSLPAGKKEGYEKMIGAAGNDVIRGKKLYIPLEFWFCRNVGLALPLIALQYHEVKINIEFETHDKCGTSITSGSGIEASLWVDYIFLDTDERRRFAQMSHEYLIEQVQFTGEEDGSSTNLKPKLNFNHPVKELVWALTTDSADGWFDYTCPVSAISSGDALATIKGNLSSAPSVIDNAKLQLNGNDRFAARDGMYFSTVQPYQHHENVPTNSGINVYSFALKPEEHQPSGTLNMSRIDSAILNIQTTRAVTGGKLLIYAHSYNVLRILSGMGGLAYSN
jgi:hypothetical protein